MRLLLFVAFLLCLTAAVRGVSSVVDDVVDTTLQSSVMDDVVDTTLQSAVDALVEQHEKREKKKHPKPMMTSAIPMQHLIDSPTSAISDVTNMAAGQTYSQVGSQPAPAPVKVKTDKVEVETINWNDAINGIGRAGLRQCIVAATKSSMQNAPLLLEGKVDKFVEKVVSSSGRSGLVSSGIKTILTINPKTLWPITFAGVGFNINRLCEKGTWMDCGVATVAELAKFGTVTWWRRASGKQYPSFVKGAVVYGAGTFFIDLFYVTVERYAGLNVK